MSYFYSDTAREHEKTALPDVEVWHDSAYSCDDCGRLSAQEHDDPHCHECKSPNGGFIWGYWYAFGFPGCLHDSEPCGPFETEEAAVDAARELCEDW